MHWRRDAVLDDEWILRPIGNHKKCLACIGKGVHCVCRPRTLGIVLPQYSKAKGFDILNLHNNPVAHLLDAQPLPTIEI
jgi:hypothetical protein